MKKTKFQKLIQKPLRFHHQDIHEEIDNIKVLLYELNNQMQGLQYRIDQLLQKTDLWMPEYDDVE
jgi:uncharacterized protein YoxC